MRSSPSQRVKSSSDLDRRKIDIDRDIARLKAKILHNHRQIERIHQHNHRLTERLSQIEGRNFSIAVDNRSPGATAPRFDRHRSLARLIVCAIGPIVLAIGCGCIGFAIARMLLR